MYTDQKIIELCRLGRQEGFAQLLRVYQSRVYRLARSYVYQHEDALDVTQDVFMRVINAVDHFTAGKPIWPWLRKITTTTCLNRLRSHKARPQTVPLDEARDQPDTANSAADPVHAALIASDRDLIKQALEDLPPLHRMVVVLRHEEDLTYEEIARVMNLPLGTVKTYLFRGRRTLRDILEREVSQ